MIPSSQHFNWSCPRCGCPTEHITKVAGNALHCAGCDYLWTLDPDEARFLLDREQGFPDDLDAWVAARG